MLLLAVLGSLLITLFARLGYNMFFSRKQGAGLLPFAVDGSGELVFLCHRTLSGKKRGTLIDWGGALEPCDVEKAGRAGSGCPYMFTAAREFAEETEGLWNSPDPLLELDPRRNIVRDTADTLRALRATLARHPRWSAAHSRFHPYFYYRLFLLPVEYQELEAINERFQLETLLPSSGFHKARVLRWVPAEEFLRHYLSNDGMLFARLQSLRGLADICENIREEYLKVMEKEAHYHMGHTTLKVPMSMHVDNRGRLVEALQAESHPANSYILLEGGKSETRHDTDHEPVFRQESFFHWTFGVSEPDCYGAVSTADGHSVLFIPRLPKEYAVWMGKIYPPEHFMAKYAVDEVRYTDELDDFFEAKDGTVFVLKGRNTDSGNDAKPASFDGIEKCTVDEARLHPLIVRCRVIKSAAEIEVMRYVGFMSSEAHKAVMRAVAPGLFEYQMESLFRHVTYSQGGCRNMSYTCICGTGLNGSILHYGHAGAPNDKRIEEGDMCLFDMGAEYHCYSSDITCSFPANGRFTADQRTIYEAVLASRNAVMAAMRPGVSYKDMHRLADRVHCEKLKEAGLLTGDVDAMMEAFVGTLFMPHGLGHMLGIDTHDVGGYWVGSGVERTMEPGLRSLRCGVVLEENMVLTVEPGIYFNPETLLPAFEDEKLAPFLVKDRIMAFMNFGGVRIEDDVVVTADGIENTTKVPRTVAEIEAWMAGKDEEPTPGRSDA